MKVMKHYLCHYITTSILLLLLSTAQAKRTPQSHPNDEHAEWPSQKIDEERKMRPIAAEYKLQIAAGSRLPYCLHACGSCSPCRLVMVHLHCSSLIAEAETCPMAYKCVCSNKIYPVP